MKRRFVFEIKEQNNTSPYKITAFINVPKNWHGMSEDDQREFLVRPIGNHMHPGQILSHASPFQRATGADIVEDFIFTEIVDEERGE